MKKQVHGQTIGVVAIDTATTFLAAGGPAWVDTDLSGSIPAGAIGIIAFAIAAAAGDFGARAHGEATAPLVNLNIVPIVSGVDSARHVDFHQDAAQAVNYRVTHYIRRQ